MGGLNRFLAFAIPFLVVVSAWSQAMAGADRVWEVESGDTLSGLAERFEVEVVELRSWNGLTDDRLHIGQHLRVSDATKPAVGGPSYRVESGDTLGEIAQKIGLELEELLRLNPGVQPDRIRVGQRLRIGELGRKVAHTVVVGENLTVLASVYETTISEILRVNPGLHPDRIRTGKSLVIYTRIPESRSESIGAPSAGTLRAGVPLRAHPGYVIRDRVRSYATAETVLSMGHAFDRLRRRFPEAPKVEVHDLSLRSGGPITDHRSHQSGRDVDIAYMYRGCKKRACRFKKVAPTELDSKRQWALLKPWLENVRAEAIFIDYGLQRELYREAKRDGANAAQLQLWFQYPRGRNSSLGVIRHYPAHADHLHVRFACHESDPECKTFRPLLMQAQHASR